MLFRSWHAEYLGADEDRYAPLFRRLARTDDGESARGMGGDMFALFARRERDATARIMHDLEGLLEVRGAQARCLECPGVVSVAAASKAQVAHPVTSLLALLLD